MWSKEAGAWVAGGLLLLGCSGASGASTSGTLPSGPEWVALEPEDATGLPVIYLHGATQDADQLLDEESYPVIADLGAELAQRGHPVLAVSTGDTWGNEDARAVITEAADHLDAERVVVVGASMGGGGALAWAASEPDRVACVAGIVPVSDLRQIVEDDPSGLAASVTAAHPDGVAGSNPVELAEAGRLDGLRYRAWYSPDDEVVDGETVEAVVGAVGGSAVEVSGDHNSALDDIDLDDVADFVDGC